MKSIFFDSILIEIKKSYKIGSSQTLILGYIAYLCQKFYLKKGVGGMHVIISNQSLSKNLDISKSTVKRTIEELIQVGLIVRHIEGDFNNKRTLILTDQFLGFYKGKLQNKTGEDLKESMLDENTEMTAETEYEASFKKKTSQGVNLNPGSIKSFGRANLNPEEGENDPFFRSKLNPLIEIDPNNKNYRNTNQTSYEEQSLKRRQRKEFLEGLTFEIYNYIDQSYVYLCSRHNYKTATQTPLTGAKLLYCKRFIGFALRYAKPDELRAIVSRKIGVLNESKIAFLKYHEHLNFNTFFGFHDLFANIEDLKNPRDAWQRTLHVNYAKEREVPLLSGLGENVLRPLYTLEDHLNVLLKEHEEEKKGLKNSQKESKMQEDGLTKGLSYKELKNQEKEKEKKSKSKQTPPPDILEKGEEEQSFKERLDITKNNEDDFYY